jgi:hypothetical protein
MTKMKKTMMLEPLIPIKPLGMDDDMNEDDDDDSDDDDHRDKRC